MPNALPGLLTKDRELEIVRDAMACECGSRLVLTIYGNWLREKTADKYEVTEGKKIKL